MKKIKDTAGYIAYIYPKSLVFGIVIFVISIVAIVSDCLKKIPYWSYVETPIEYQLDASDSYGRRIGSTFI